MAVAVEVYTPERQQEWDALVASAKNGHFLFERGYMDYHADRFTDHSLTAAIDGKLSAVFPASRDGDTVISHGGLTFGGLIVEPKLRGKVALELFDEILEQLRKAGISQLVYKAVPHIYHRLPAEDELYALWRAGAELSRRDISSTIDYRDRLRASKGRRAAAKAARRDGVEVRQTDQWDRFVAIETELLQAKYGVQMVHTADELKLLAGRFPNNIELWGAFRGDELLGGVVMYLTGTVAHAQYISATEEGKMLGALDPVLERLIEERCAGFRCFDFGISTEDAGRVLNVPLLENKESYGARTTVYDQYTIAL